MEKLNPSVNFVDKRKYLREPSNLSIEFSLNVLDFHQIKKVSTNGIAVDISKCGIGLTTEFPLEPGHVLIFKPTIPEVGVVKWISTHGSQTRAGIQFYGVCRES